MSTNAKESMICWDADGQRVRRVPWPDVIGLSDDYDFTIGACDDVFQKANFEKRKALLFINAMHMIVRDNCDPMAVHKAMLGFDEYLDGLSDDMPMVRLDAA
jgi:hypothetical protein